MSIVESNVVDVGRHIIQQCWHCCTIAPDSAREYLAVNIVIVGVLEKHFAIRLTYIIPWVFSHDIHRRDKPENGVALVYMITDLCIHLVFKTIDILGVGLLIFKDTIKYQRVFFISRRYTGSHAEKHEGQ